MFNTAFQLIVLVAIISSCKEVETRTLTSSITASAASSSAGTQTSGTTNDYTITLTQNGDSDATSISFATPSAPFSFKGGTFPGTGGTCSTTWSGSCTVILSYSPVDLILSTATATITYDSYGTTKTFSFTLSGSSVLGSCYAASGEVDDYVAAADSECDSNWTNTPVTGGNVSLDERTGLMWSRDSEAGDIVSETDGIHDGLMNWFEANGTTANGGGAVCTNANHADCNTDGESYCGALNTISYGTFTDWRAPGQKELMQAYVNGASHNATVFDSSKRYWGNTTESDNALYGSYQRFGYGNNGVYFKNRVTTVSGICVRSGATAEITSLASCNAASEVDDFLSNGTVECDSTWTNLAVTGGNVSTDTRTGMMWSRQNQTGDIVSERDGIQDGYINWFEATGTTAAGTLCNNTDNTDCNPDGESYCGHLNTISYGGFANWRPPGQKEFMQAYINGGTHLASVFTVTDSYWANTTESDSSVWGSYRRFGYGNGADWQKYGGWGKAICIRYAH